MMAAALAVVMSGCAKEDKDICGEWHLSDISVVTKAQEPYEVSVYLSFSKTGGFDLYQKLQDGKYVHYTGNWEWWMASSMVSMQTARLGARAAMRCHCPLKH